MAGIFVSVVMVGIMAGGSYYLRYRLRKQREEWQKRRPFLSSPYRPERPDLSLRIIVAHESGHALTAWFSRYVHRIKSIDVQRGFVSFLHENSQTPHGLYAQIVIAMGGLAGEIISIGKIMTARSSYSDLGKARILAEKLLARSRSKSIMSLLTKYEPHEFPLDISKMFKDGLTEEMTTILNSAYLDAKKLILEHKSGFDRLQQKLLREHRLETDDIVKIFGIRPWAP